MVNSACPLCEDTGHPRHLIEKNGYTVVRCPHCDLVRVDPQPDPEDIERYYSAEQGYHVHLVEDVKEQKRLAGRNRERLDLIEKHITERGPLLDVGCSLGLFLGHAKQRGWEASGVEINAHTVEQAQLRCGATVHHGNLETVTLASGSQLVVTFLDTLEHVLDPRSDLEKAHELLRPGGIVMVTAPNIDGLLPRSTYRLLAQPFGVWDHPSPPAHLFDFSVKTLTMMLQKAGFEPVLAKTETIRMGYAAGKLTAALITVGKKVLGRSGSPARATGCPGEARARPGLAPGARGRSSRSQQALRSAAMLVSLSWILAIYPFGALLNRSNSLVVIGRKPRG
ncbi:MAG: class I SAM-dependent methyltransferase [bacterium]